MEGMNIGFFINIRKEVDCKDNRFKNEESYVRERRDTNNPAFSSFIHLLFVSRLSHSLLPPVILTRRARFPTGSDRSERQRNECREETKGTGRDPTRRERNPGPCHVERLTMERL